MCLAAPQALGQSMNTDDAISAALAECLQRLERGELSARDRIIELCSDRLHALAHRMLGRFPGVRRWEDTDDVFQNAAMRLHRALGAMQFDSPRSIMALAATQLHRELIDLARRHAGPASYAANHGTNVMPQTAADDGPEQYIDQRPSGDTNLDRWTLFHEAIGNLPEDQREVFHLVWYLGADQKTIASLLDCSERTVKYRWRSAREAVREALDGKPPQP
jgi:RNA polymerase sigma factor (sigma-70 family)